MDQSYHNEKIVGDQEDSEYKKWDIQRIYGDIGREIVRKNEIEWERGNIEWDWVLSKMSDRARVRFSDSEL